MPLGGGGKDGGTSTLCCFTLCSPAAATVSEVVSCAARAKQPEQRRMRRQEGQARLTGVCAVNSALHAFRDASHAKDLDVEGTPTRLGEWHSATHTLLHGTA